MYLEQHWLIYFFRQFLPCEHWHGFGTRANPSGRSILWSLLSLHFIMASQTAGAGIVLSVWVFAVENQSVALAAQSSVALHGHFTQGFVFSVCSHLEVKAKCSEMLHCALPWLGFQWLQMKGIFSFLKKSQQLNWFDCIKFSENLWLGLLLYSPAWFSCPLAMKGLSLTLPLNLASGLLCIFLTSLCIFLTPL